MIHRRYKLLKETVRAVNVAALDAPPLYQALLHDEVDRLRAQPRYRDPKHLIPFGCKAYSQCDEDGIIAEIFRRIGTTNKRFVEFGIGDGLENNTLTLLFDGWCGLWMDASAETIHAIQSSFSGIISAGRLRVAAAFLNRDNIDGLIENSFWSGEIDLLSVDVDGNDYHLLCAINCVRPRVIVIEYNAKFFPPIQYCMEYNPSHVWSGNDCFGASLSFLEVRLRDRGYCLVGCGLSGANAFFVRKDLVADRFLDPFSAEIHYEPARYYLTNLSSGHSATYDTLARSLEISPVVGP